MNKPESDNKDLEPRDMDALQAAIEALHALVMTQQQQIDNLLVSLSSMLAVLDEALPLRLRQFEEQLGQHSDLQLFGAADALQQKAYATELAGLQSLLARLRKP